MVTKYILVMQTYDGRIVHRHSIGVINESGQQEADCEAMEMMGTRLINWARDIRRSNADRDVL